MNVARATPGARRGRGAHGKGHEEHKAHKAAGLQGFKDKEAKDKEKKEKEEGEEGEPKEKEEEVHRTSARVVAFLDGGAMTFVMTILTVLTLWGDDCRLAMTPKEHDAWMLIVNLIATIAVVVVFFVSSVFQEGYKWSFYFWLDMVAALSLLADNPWVMTFLRWILKLDQTDAAGATDSAKTARTARLARLVRLVRLVRIVKLYSMMTKAKGQQQAAAAPDAATAPEASAMRAASQPVRKHLVLGPFSMGLVVLAVAAAVIGAIRARARAVWVKGLKYARQTNADEFV